MAMTGPNLPAGTRHGGLNQTCRLGKRLPPGLPAAGLIGQLRNVSISLRRDDAPRIARSPLGSDRSP